MPTAPSATPPEVMYLLAQILAIQTPLQMSRLPAV